MNVQSNQDGMCKNSLSPKLVTSIDGLVIIGQYNGSSVAAEDSTRISCIGLCKL